MKIKIWPPGALQTSYIIYSVFSPNCGPNCGRSVGWEVGGQPEVESHGNCWGHSIYWMFRNQSVNVSSPQCYSIVVDCCVRCPAVVVV